METIAIHGDDATTHDGIAGCLGAFTTTLDRLAAHHRAGIPFAGETWVSAANLTALPAIARRGAAAGAIRWTWIAADQRALTIRDPGEPGGQEHAAQPAPIAALAAALPALALALARCRAAGIVARVVGFPRCLVVSEFAEFAELVELAAHAESGTPAGDPQASCLLEAHCDLAEACPKLSHAYIAAHGWELDRLRPPPRRRPWSEPTVLPPGPGGLHPAQAAWLALLGPDPALRSQVEGIERGRHTLRYRLRLPDGRRLVLELRDAGDPRPAFARSRSFAIAYTRPEGPESASTRRAPTTLTTWIAGFAAAIVAHDDGKLRL